MFINLNEIFEMITLSQCFWISAIGAGVEGGESAQHIGFHDLHNFDLAQHLSQDSRFLKSVHIVGCC